MSLHEKFCLMTIHFSYLSGLGCILGLVSVFCLLVQVEDFSLLLYF
jgi:hypothetical protein